MKTIAAIFAAVSSFSAVAQTPPPAIDVTAADVQAFLKQLPRDAVNDKPIRIVDVGGYRVGVYGVLRPKAVQQEAVLHETKVTEVYHMLDGAGTLVTGGTLIDPKREPPETTTLRGSRIEGGTSRRVTKGDIVIIPGRVPHWWSKLEGDITYLIVRPDPEGKLPLK